MRSIRHHVVMFNANGWLQSARQHGAAHRHVAKGGEFRGIPRCDESIDSECRYRVAFNQRGVHLQNNVVIALARGIDNATMEQKRIGFKAMLGI